MCSGNNIEKKGRYYTTDERKSLDSGNYEEAAEACRDRHSEKAVYMAFSRASNSKLTPDGIPKTLDRLCIRLGIRHYKSANPSFAKCRKTRSRQHEILSFLASLPNAEHYLEEHWLDTPELWPFVDPDRIRYSYGDSCGDLRKALQTRMDSWCDKWVPFSLTSFSGPDALPGDLYLFPFAEELKDSRIPRSRKRYAAGSTFLALSQADGSRKRMKPCSSAVSGILELSGRMSIGYISFRFGVPVADVIGIINSGKTPEEI